jgi:hypothetical protein
MQGEFVPRANDGGLFGAPPPPETLDTSDDTPLARRMRALSEPRLFLLRRPWDEKNSRLRQEITVEEARALKSFFTMSAADGGRRVAIIDAAERQSAVVTGSHNWSVSANTKNDENKEMKSKQLFKPIGDWRTNRHEREQFVHTKIKTTVRVSAKLDLQDDYKI